MEKLFIAVVDDDVDDCEILATAFRRSYSGMTVLTFGSGSGLLSFLEAAPAMPELVVLDVYMPAMDGLEVVRGMKADARMEAIPVVLLSTSLNDTISRSISSFEDVSFMAKPYDLDHYMVLATDIIYRTAP